MSTDGLRDLVMVDEVSKTKELVVALLAKGMTHASIAEALGGRVTSRTIYRWAKGETSPQRRSDLIALEQLSRSLQTSENGIA